MEGRAVAEGGCRVVVVAELKTGAGVHAGGDVAGGPFARDGDRPEVRVAILRGRGARVVAPAENIEEVRAPLDREPSEREGRGLHVDAAGLDRDVIGRGAEDTSVDGETAERAADVD